MPHAHIDLLLPPDSESPSVARCSLDGLAEFLSAEQLEYARLLVTELVTNSVLHASLAPPDDIRLWVAVSEAQLRVEVSDLGTGFEKPSSNGLTGESSLSLPAPENGHGRGLYLLERLSDRWGVCLDGITSVWFEIDHG